mgnify:FL=1
MDTLSFKVENAVWKWEGSVNINYEVAYDAESNSTTVRFLESNFHYWGRDTFGSTATADISVRAADNAESLASAKMSAYGATYMEGRDYPATPQPTSVTVQHGDEDGEKAVIISASALISARMTNAATSNTNGTGSGTATKVSGTRETTKAKIYINGAAVKATPYVGREKAKAYHGRVKM